MFAGLITLDFSNCSIFRMATKLLRLVKDKKKLDEGGSIIFTVDSDKTPLGISGKYFQGRTHFQHGCFSKLFLCEENGCN